MWLSKAAHFISIIANRTVRGVSVVAASAMIAMMFLTGTDVTLRYIFNSPLPGSMELTEFMMVIVVALGLSYCALQMGHVRVDVVVSRLPKRAQVVMNTIASFVFLGLFILITWQTVPRVKAMIDVQLRSQVMGIPVPPFALVVTAGGAVLCLVLLRDFFDDLYQVLKK